MGTRYPTDVYDQLVWTLDETSAPYHSTGVLAQDLNFHAGPYQSNSTTISGLFDYGVLFPGAAHNDVYLDSGFPTPAVGEVAAPVTLSAWFWPRSITAQQAIAAKNYRQQFSGYFYPYYAVGVYTDSTGHFCGLVSVGGTPYILTGPVAAANTWHLIGLTYDGTTVNLYADGVLVASQSVTGAIDYGANGPWTLGGDLSNAQGLNGIVDDVRWASTVRDASWFSNVYTQGTSSGGGGGGGGGVPVSLSSAFKSGFSFI